MRAAQVVELSGPDGVEVREVDEPAAGGGELLVDVRAAGISYPELLLSRGLYQVKPEPPFTLGSELSGVVREAPAGSGFAAGDRVAAFTMGAFADVVAAPLHVAFRLPEELDFREGAGLVMNYHTAHFCLLRRGELREGESLLVHGAAGGVGTAAVQVGRARGARVVAVVSSDEKERVARRAGAGTVIRSDGDWQAAAKEVGPFDVVFDPVGGDRFDDSIRLLAPEGRIVVVGFAEGRIPEVAVNRLLYRCVSVVGAAWGHFALERPQYLREVGDDLERMVSAGHVRPIVGGAYAMEEVPDALRDLDSRRAVGKLVLDLEKDPR